MADVEKSGQADGALPGGVDPEAAGVVEAILFAADKPLPPAKIAEVAELDGVRTVRRIVDALNGRYERVGCAFRIVEVAGGYQMQSLPKYGEVLARLYKARREARLSQAALETLAIIAYRQPVLRADVEAIRGVACGEVIRGLMEKNLVRIVGRADEIGRPLLYGTTRHFMEVFGLASLDDLPKVEELRQPIEMPAPRPTGQESERADDEEAAAEENRRAGDGQDEATQEAQTPSRQ